MMVETHELHADQIEYWNGRGGAHWVAQQARTDLVIAEIAEIAIARAQVRPGETVLDVGCGCGATTIELARTVGPNGRVIALDVSEPMLGRARERLAGADNVEFVLADAATHRFPTAAADLLFSRFGVMFFGAPVAAFTNLRHALKPGARLTFACWRKPSENPWMLVPLGAAYEHVPPLPKLGPEDPGPFSFASPDRVTRILTEAGFTSPRFEAVDLTLDLGSGDGLDAAVGYSVEIGATSRALDGQPTEIRAKAAQSIRRALEPYVDAQGVRLPAAIWIVHASVP
jgi:SAM-dependent methyltransferase